MGVRNVVVIVVKLQDHEGEISWVKGYVKFEPERTLSEMEILAGLFAGVVGPITNAQILTWSYHVETYQGFALPAIPVDEPYINIEDKLFITWREQGSGRPYTIELPAPKGTCFLGDRETMDPNGAGVGAFTTWVHDNLVTSTGGVDMKLIKGSLLRKPIRKRLRQGIPTEQGG